MIKNFLLTFFAIFLSLILSYHPALSKEDTAQITLRKTAISKENLYTYIVKKGDIISVIVRRIPGITEEDIADNYRLIQELNPNIEDINKLRVGQKLVLPGKPITEGKQKTAVTVATVADTGYQSKDLPATDSKTYVIKKGDTLIKIITRELKNINDIKETLKIIKSMNPKIVNVNKIYAGDSIKLPTKDFFLLAGQKAAPVDRVEDRLIEESLAQPEKVIEAKEKITMPLEAQLAVIKHVLSQMNATVSTTGNYYLPIPKTGQITIDCSKMPVIEFDDSSTLFLDLENRAPVNLKKIISDHWSNFSLVTVDKKDDVIVILRKIFGSSKNYTMTKQSKFLSVGSSLTAEFFVDWIIKKQTQPALTQGLRILYNNNVPFPLALKNYSRNNGVIITEISAKDGLVRKPEEIYSLKPMQVYPTASAKDFSHAFLSDLGLNANKDVAIKVFSTETDGLNLSIKADVVVEDAGSNYIIYSHELSPQFINVLTQAGNKLIFINNTDSPKNIMEKILRELNIPCVSGNFSFSGLDKNMAPFTLNFSGTKIKTDKNIYVINFDIDHELRGLLQEAWSAHIARY